jgi:ABC-2 type transport system permease protein
VPSYGVDPGAMLLLGVLAVVLSAAAIWLFVRRDVGGTVPLPGWLRLPERRASTALPVGDWSLRSVYARSLSTIAMPTFWWTIGLAGFAAWMVVAIQQMESRLNVLLTSPAAAALLKNLGGGVSIGASLLSAMFGFLPLLLMAFAVTQVSSWASDEQDGRLELVLATPQSRARVILGRFAALATATIAIGVVTLLATGATSAATGVKLDPANLAAASLGMIPLGLLVAAIGYLASGWLRSAADTGLLSFLLVLWFFISFIGPELQWPDAALRLSALYYYGTPLVHGLQTSSVVGVIAVAAVALALGTLRFSRKDIAV